MSVGDPPIRKSAEPVEEKWTQHPTNPRIEISSTTGKWRTKDAPAPVQDWSEYFG